MSSEMEGFLRAWTLRYWETENDLEIKKTILYFKEIKDGKIHGEGETDGKKFQIEGVWNSAENAIQGTFSCFGKFSGTFSLKKTQEGAMPEARGSYSLECGLSLTKHSQGEFLLTRPECLHVGI